jgi:hypothetical protein
MNKLNIIQDSRSSQDFSYSQGESPAAAHLLIYFKKLKLQKIFLLA